MAKVVGPCMSTEAHGSISAGLTFSKKKTGQQVRYQRKQADVFTDTRADVRDIYRLALCCWNNKTDEQRDVFNQVTIDQNLHITGWNYFLKLAYNNPLTYLGLLCYWSMNVQNGASVKDLSKNGYTGTLKPTYPGNCPVYAASKNDKLFTCLDFDGTDDYVSFASLPASGYLSASFWYSTTSIATANQGFLHHGTSGNFRFYWFKQGVNDWQLYMFDSVGGKSYRYRNVTPIGTGAWTNDVLVFRVSDKKVLWYRNGALIGTLTSDYNVAILASTVFQLGRYGTSQSFDGLIDEVSLWDRVLSAAEILSLYDCFK